MLGESVLRQACAPPSLTAADQQLLVSSGAFDLEFYAAQCGLPYDSDLVRHYLDVGWKWGLQPRPGFEGAFLQPFYEAAGLSGPPLLTWVDLNALGCTPPTKRIEAEHQADAIRSIPAFDAAWYGRRLQGSLDPALHYVIVGEALGWRPSPVFDPVFYCERNPDIALAGVSPLLHFFNSGEREQRSAKPVVEDLAFPHVDRSDGERVVLMLVHEASRTGAPLLGLSLATKLARQHKVVSVILRSGPLDRNFATVSAALVGPMDWRHWHPAEMSRVADRLVEVYKPLYAVANSIETSQLVPHLSMRGVPCLSLVHEFASYTRPLGKLSNAFDWASNIVFPADVVAQSSFKVFPHLGHRQGVHVFPQGRVDLPPEIVSSDAQPRLSLGAHAAPAVEIRPADAPHTFVVLGAGTVDIRKGVDVFVATAAACRRQAPELDIRFVWIGGGYDPDKDLIFSAYLAEHIDRSGMADIVRVIKPTTDLNPIYAASDVFLMSSRLDPQPNVAIDALSRGLPVVCFAGATGTAEVLGADPATAGLVAPYLDAASAAAIICRLAGDPIGLDEMRISVRRLAEQVFDMDGYTAKLDAFGRQAATRLRAEDLQTLSEAELDPDMIVPPGELVPGPHGLAMVVRQQWASVGMSEGQTANAWFRRGYAGFHPQIYASHHAEACISRGETPLAHWIRSGRPAGPWTRQVLPPLALPKASAVRVALHGHFFYPDLLPDLLARLDANKTQCDLFLTTDTDEKAAALIAACAGRRGCEIALTPNRGRDIGPFLHLMDRIIDHRYDIVGHIHGKKSKSTDAAMGERWRDFLWSNLIGPESMLDAVAAACLTVPDVGLFMAEDPHLVGWDGNKTIAMQLASRLSLDVALEDMFDFPLGTMFWVRPKAIAPLLDLKLRWDDFPAEPVPDDATTLHALERLIPFVVRSAGFAIAGLRAPGTNW